MCTSTGAGRTKHLVVAPDGSGDVRSLEDAVQVAAPGTTLILRAGTHRLSRPLTIHQSLTLVGDGRKSTRVACSSPGYVMRVEGDGRFAARDVTFTHEGAQGAHVVEVQCGEIDLRRCSFLGGVHDKVAKTGGVGLSLLGQVRGMVAGCETSGNGLHGISVQGQAQPTLQRNTCRANKDIGIFFSGSATGLARDNVCADNGTFGIAVGGQAQPILQRNTCRANRAGTIVFLSSGGERTTR